MKLISLVLLTAAIVFGQWQAVERLPAGSRIELFSAGGERAKVTFVSANAQQIVVRDKSGESTVARADVREVKVAAPERRVRNGLIGVAIGVGAGAGIGAAICPHCANEGAGLKYVGPGVAIGAAVGSLAFLPSPYRTIYKNK